MSKEFDLLVVGELNTDLILNRLEGMPIVGKEILAKDMALVLGSSSAILASNICTLGSKVKFVGKVGKDSFADFILNTLIEKGINTSDILFSPTSKTGCTVVLNDAEDRANITYPGAMAELTFHDINKEVLAKARHLHVSSLFLQTGLLPDIVLLFKNAKEAGLSTSLDPQWDPAEKWNIHLEQLLPYVDLFMPNLSELMAITHTHNLDEALDWIKKKDTVTVLKNGRQGAYIWDGNEMLLQPAFTNTKIVDAVGAGDSFNAGFIHQYLQNKPLRQCLEFAAVMGAVNTTGVGGTAAFSNLSSVKNTAKEYFNYTF